MEEEVQDTTTVTVEPEYTEPTDAAQKAGARHSASDRKDMQVLHDIAVKQGAACPTYTKNALKALEETEDELVVGNHIILFGGRDLTGYAIGKNADGSLGEFFTKATDLESDYTKTGRLYVDFEHGRDPDNVGNTKHNILGYVDWKTKSVTDEGVFVKRVLYRRNKYVKMLEPLIKAGLIGNSSEAVPDNIHKAENGELTRWGLHRDTLTVTPMEPRMLDENALAAVKALAEMLPEFKSLLITSKDTALPVEEEKQDQPTNQPVKMENKTMNELTESAVADIAAKAVASALAEREVKEKAEAQKAAELKAAEDAGYKKAVEDLKDRKAPAFNTITERGFSEEKDAVPGFKHWLFTGEKNGALIAPDSSFEKIQSGKAAWNVTTGASGGFLVPDPLYNRIIAKRDIMSWVRQVSCMFLTTPSDHLLVPREDTKLTDFVLTSEAGSYNQNEGTVSQKDLILYKYTKRTQMSEEFLMYNGTNWENWFSDALGRSVAGTENTIFSTGTGTSQPEGIVTGATVANTTATTDIILPSELSALIGYLGGGYNVASECAMLMANVTKWYLKGSGGTSAVPFAYIQTPADGDFFGYKAVVNDDLEPYTTASAKCVLFGNFNYFAVVEKPGMVIQRNPYLSMATGQIDIFASIFRGSGVLQSEAFYYLTNKAS